MKQIDISTPKYPNTFAFVGDGDFDWLNQWKWHAEGYHGTLYARRTIYEPEPRSISMHRLIADTPDGMQTDHIDGNGLNNQRHNLRLCTHSQNQMNRKSQSNNTSGFRVFIGVER